jgi:hypothetical protein
MAVNGLRSAIHAGSTNTQRAAPRTPISRVDQLADSGAEPAVQSYSETALGLLRPRSVSVDRSA